MALGSLFDQVQRWQESNESVLPAVQPGSDLDGDDAGLGYLQLSHVVTSSLVAAVDELDALRRLIVDAHAIAAYAPLTLIRAGLENAAVAVWLLQPPERIERQRRRLTLALQDNFDQRQVGKIIDSETSETVYAKRRADIFGYAADLGIAIPQDRRAFAGYEAVVKAAGEYLARTLPQEAFYRRPDAALAAWKACSGIAHGAQWAWVALLQRVEISSQDAVITSSVSSSLQTIASATSVAVDMTKAARNLQNHRRLSFTEH